MDVFDSKGGDSRGVFWASRTDRQFRSLTFSSPRLAEKTNRLGLEISLRPCVRLHHARVFGWVGKATLSQPSSGPDGAGTDSLLFARLERTRSSRQKGGANEHGSGLRVQGSWHRGRRNRQKAVLMRAGVPLFRNFKSERDHFSGHAP